MSTWLLSYSSSLLVQEKERATKRKDTRINQLQESLSESKSRYDKLLVQCHNMTNAMDVSHQD